MKKRIVAISGSTRSHSANASLIQIIADLSRDIYEIEVFEGIALLPHFNPDLDKESPPAEVVAFRNLLSSVDGLLICTPEYVFSLPGSLKNALEWLVSTVILTDKPTGLITASAMGQKGHAELKLVMKTIGAKFTPKTQLLISGVRSKLDKAGNLMEEKTSLELRAFLAAFDKLLNAVT